MNSEVQRIEKLGLKVVRLEAVPRKIGAVMSRYVASVQTPRGQQVGFYRSTREVEFVGWGWVQHSGGRTEYDSFLRFLAALERLPQVLPEAVRG